MTFKNIQTILPLNMYNRFKEIAKTKKETLKDATTEAIYDWIAKNESLENDDFFDISYQGFETKSSELSKKVDEFLYGDTK